MECKVKKVVVMNVPHFLRVSDRCRDADWDLCAFVSVKRSPALRLVVVTRGVARPETRLMRTDERMEKIWFFQLITNLSSSMMACGLIFGVVALGFVCIASPCWKIREWVRITEMNRDSRLYLPVEVGFRWFLEWLSWAALVRFRIFWAFAEKQNTQLAVANNNTRTSKRRIVFHKHES